MTKRLVTPQSEKCFFFLNVCLLLESSLSPCVTNKQSSFSLSFSNWTLYLPFFFPSKFAFCRSRKKVMAEEETELRDKQKKEIAKWFLLNAPAGEIQYVAKGLSLSLYCSVWWISSTFYLVFWILIRFVSIDFCFSAFFLDFYFFFRADLRSVLNNVDVYDEAASEAFPVYNKSHMICLEMPGRFGDVSPGNPYYILFQC